MFQSYNIMTSCSRITCFLLGFALLTLFTASSQAKPNFMENGPAVFYRVPSTRSKERIPRKGGCASFGHSCFGGHGKRAELPPDGGASSNHIFSIDPIDYQSLQLFQQLCTLQPDQYLRLAPVFRRLAERYTLEADEPLPRK